MSLAAVWLLLVAPELDWDAPLHCPAREQGRAAIEHYLGRPLGEDDPDTRVVVVEARGGYRLELSTVAGHHVIEGADCARLVQQAASVAAIAIDPLGLPAQTLGVPAQVAEPVGLERVELEPGAELDPADPEPTPRPRAPTRVPTGERPLFQPLLGDLDVEADRPAKPEPEPEPERSLRAGLFATGGASFGVFPNVAPGFALGLGLDRGLLHLDVAGSGWFAGRFRAPDSEVGGDLTAWQLGLRPCVVPKLGRVEFRVCATGAGGQVRARGTGVVDARRVAHPWIQAGGELGLAVVLHRRAALVVDGGVAANLVRPAFWTEDPAAAYTMGVVAGRTGLGVEVRFP